MKGRGIYIVFALLLIAAHPASKERISIESALEKGLISIEATSLGGHSGKVVSLLITPRVNKSFQLFIPAGTLFLPEEEGDQNIFVVKDQDELMAGSAKKIVVEGFCAESNDRSPGEGSTFAVTRSKDERLTKLANYMRDKEFSPDVKQSAVWAVSDNAPISYISGNEEDESVKALRKFISELTGQPNVWYSTERNIAIREDRTIEATPVKVSGDIDYRVTRPGKMTAGVFKEDGTKLFSLGDGMQLPRSGDYSFFFNLTVKGWKDGIYQVKVFIDQSPIHIQEFEV